MAQILLPLGFRVAGFLPGTSRFCRVGVAVSEPLAAFDAGAIMQSRDGELQSLCRKCANVADCVLPLASNFPVVECTTYRPAATPRASIPDSSFRFKSEVEHEQPKGLCSDCEMRETCTISRPESGVWHCQNYR